jgi:hypothetical protein
LVARRLVSLESLGGGALTNVQLYFAIGIPTFTILCSLVIALLQLSHVMTQLNARFTSLESNMNFRFSALESKMSIFEGDMKMLVRSTNELDVRLARLEERLAR